MSGIRTELTLAIGFLTRLRLPPVDYSDAAMARATRWYPCVEIAIGTALALLFWGLSFVLPQALVALLTIAAGMLLTGALHEDGLADLADGLGGSADKDRALEIMRDSRIGTYGVLALILTLAIKATALAMLPVPAAIVALIAGHGLGRLSILWLMDRLSYARKTGAGDFISDAPKPEKTIPIICLAAIIALIATTLGPLSATAVFLALALLLALISNRLNTRLQGYTGDALGASEQLTETLIPLVLLACL
jgi:adenosylcobinamide-GDP ribazoletransferase